jgi:hypothetical protein
MQEEEEEEMETETVEQVEVIPPDPTIQQTPQGNHSYENINAPTHVKYRTILSMGYIGKTGNVTRKISTTIT